MRFDLYLYLCENRSDALKESFDTYRYDLNRQETFTSPHNIVDVIIYQVV